MSNYSVARKCGLYLPGREVHWVQALRSGNYGETPREDGHLSSVEDDGTIVFEVDGTLERAWNHEPRRIAYFATRSGGRIILHRRWGLLGVPDRGDGTYMFYIGDPDDHRECPAEPPTGDPLELLAETGGLSMRAEDAIEYLAHRDSQVGSPHPQQQGETT
ncbi:MAG: hypothetical protein ABIQ38_03775 [Ilumatobacteraceae bacterium]